MARRDISIESVCEMAPVERNPMTQVIGVRVVDGAPKSPE